MVAKKKSIYLIWLAFKVRMTPSVGAFQQSRPSLHARLRSLTLLLWPCALRQHARSRRMRSGPRCHAVALARSPAYAAGAPAVRAPAYPLRLYALHPLSYLTRSGRRCRCGRSKICSTVRAPAVRAPAVRTLAVRAPNPLRPCALRPLMPLLSLSLPLWPSGRMLFVYRG